MTGKENRDGSWTSIHGGNVFETARRLGCAPEDILDFSASINPLGPPEGLVDILTKAYRLLLHYPDIAVRALGEAIGHRFQVDLNRIVVGNGSTELIYALPMALQADRVLAVVPTFKEYLKAFALHGCRVEFCVSEAANNFQPTVSQLRRALEIVDPQVLLVTHPGSPSGALIPEDVRQFLLDEARTRGLVLVVDEVFIDFCEEASFLEALRDHERLILIRSMTKFYGIPGLRLGYVLTSPKWAEALRRYVPPWSVNTLAQAAGVFCLQQEKYRRETLAVVSQERAKLRTALARMPGLTVFPSAANYLLVRLGRNLPPASALKEDLLQRHRLLIRDCANFDGLTFQDFRIAVRLPQENDRLLSALAEWHRSLPVSHTN